jgi:hypothetical protein
MCERLGYFRPLSPSMQAECIIDLPELNFDPISTSTSVENRFTPLGVASFIWELMTAVSAQATQQGQLASVRGIPQS